MRDVMRDAGGARDTVLVADNATLSRRPRIDFPPSLPFHRTTDYILIP